MAVEAKGSTGGSSERMGVAKALSMGGILAALGASSCCLMPFVLFSLGISGAWIANLTALAPYQPLFVAVALACLGGGYLLVRRAARAACAGGVSCARPGSDRLFRIGLWTAALLVLVAVVLPRLAPLIISS